MLRQAAAGARLSAVAPTTKTAYFAAGAALNGVRAISLTTPRCAAAAAEPQSLLRTGDEVRMSARATPQVFYIKNDNGTPDFAMGHNSIISYH